jgi:hypothetical protein
MVPSRSRASRRGHVDRLLAPRLRLAFSGTEQMIVIATDAHKASHTAAALDGATGQVLAIGRCGPGAPRLRTCCAGLGVSAASGCGRSRHRLAFTKGVFALCDSRAHAGPTPAGPGPLRADLGA